VNSTCRRASIFNQQGDVTLKAHVANVCFRGRLQVFHIDVVKVDRDVAYAASILKAYCKFKVFHLF
jgi:hypothetical protein